MSLDLNYLWGNRYALTYDIDQQNSAYIMVRIPVNSETFLFRELFKNMGFYKKADRIEYKCMVDKLPPEILSPFQWKSQNDLNWSNDTLVQFVQQIMAGTSDFDQQFPLQNWQYDHHMTHGDNCISIGLINGLPCALVVVQTDAQLGWARISYMGLTESQRSKGFGRLIHRRAFEMIKDQGANVYFGYTHLHNVPMRRLLESLDSMAVTKCEEWELKLQI